MVHPGAAQAHGEASCPKPVARYTDRPSVRSKKPRLENTVAARRQHFIEHAQLAEMGETFGRNKFSAKLLSRKLLAFDQYYMTVLSCESDRTREVSATKA